MTLTDAGPIIALLDKDDAHHAECLAAIKKLSAAPLLTTWPCFTEAMYLLGSVGGYRYQEELWKLHTTGRMVLHDARSGETHRMMELMSQYQDVPMDLADSSLMALADELDIRRLFTLDQDFRIYRLKDGSVLEIIPLTDNSTTP